MTSGDKLKLKGEVHLTPCEKLDIFISRLSPNKEESFQFSRGERWSQSRERSLKFSNTKFYKTGVKC